MTQDTTEQNQDSGGLDITVIIDRSGSMGEIRDDAIGAFNTFLTDHQKTDPDALLSIILFDHEYEVLATGFPILGIRPLTHETYIPRGNTALLDAIGKTIADIEGRAHTANAVLVAILTDGQENASVEWHADQIKELIREREAKGWDFYYLSAELSAFTDGRSMGIDPRKISTFKKECIHDAYLDLNEAINEKKRIMMEIKRKKKNSPDKMYQ